MGTTHRPFDRFDRAHRELNQVFWSSEIAGALVLEKVIADRPIGKRIYDLFPGLNCHAFWPPANARELRLKGRPEVKYNPGMGEFTTHLRANLAQTSRYVIVRFHSCLEGFLRLRLAPFIVEPDQKKKKGVMRGLLKDPYPSLAERLKNKNPNIPFCAQITIDTARLAQVFRTIRNVVVHHDESVDPWGRPWTVDEMEQQIRSDGGFEKMGDASEWDAALKKLCGKVRKCVQADPRPPAIFFFGLFSLTAFRNFAKEVDAALPEPAALPPNAT